MKQQQQQHEQHGDAELAQAQAEVLGAVMRSDAARARGMVV
eukprot:CAMPEP_0202072956 /NCGR_PEP_ID=MMETSP0964-20121228/2750_1 /ASSEMBLY_ACC=CAM_ASM_000500 /TAXON_ID=4773 /ORGANISM="Schizochytrium aggregatum, Strain ATCC28209" /LENGTH=40 /DNA_ID= /DNA_START= /DNA_END= /DNA_ORIENTATION=